MFLRLSLVHRYIPEISHGTWKRWFPKGISLSRFPGADVQVPGKLEGCIYCISLVSPSISSDFVCRKSFVLPNYRKGHIQVQCCWWHVVKGNNLMYIPPQNQEIPSKRDHPKRKKIIFQSWIFGGLSNRGPGSWELLRFKRFGSLLGSQDLVQFTLLWIPTPPEARRAATKATVSAWQLFFFEMCYLWLRKQKQPGVSAMPQNGAMPVVAVGTMILWLYICGFNYFFSPYYLGKWCHLTSIFFKFVETTS